MLLLLPDAAAGVVDIPVDRGGVGQSDRQLDLGEAALVGFLQKSFEQLSAPATTSSGRNNGDRQLSHRVAEVPRGELFTHVCPQPRGTDRIPIYLCDHAHIARTAPTDDEPGVSRVGKNLFQRAPRTVWSGRGLELVAEDYVDHSPPPFPVPPERQGVKAAFKIFWEATPGRHVVEDQVAEGDKVVTRLTAYGQHEGDLPGIPRTGNEMEMTTTVIHRGADVSYFDLK